VSSGDELPTLFLQFNGERTRFIMQTENREWQWSMVRDQSVHLSSAVIGKPDMNPSFLREGSFVWPELPHLYYVKAIRLWVTTVLSVRRADSVNGINTICRSRPSILRIYEMKYQYWSKCILICNQIRVLMLKYIKHVLSNKRILWLPIKY